MYNVREIERKRFIYVLEIVYKNEKKSIYFVQLKRNGVVRVE